MHLIQNVNKLQLTQSPTQNVLVLKRLHAPEKFKLFFII